MYYKYIYLYNVMYYKYIYLYNVMYYVYGKYINYNV